MARDLGMAADSLGALLAVSSIVSALLQLPAGAIADRIGRRPLLLAGLASFAIAQLLRWQSYSPLVLALSQVALGACSPLIVASAYALVADAYEGTGRGYAMGWLQVGVNAGQACGYLAAGFAGPHLGWRSFSLTLVVLPLALLPAVLWVREPAHSRSNASITKGTVDAVRFLARREAALLAAVASLALGAGVASTYLIPFIGSAHGVPRSSLSLLLMPYVAGAVLGSPLAGRLADRVGTRGPLIGVALLAAAGAAVFAAGGFSYPAVIACHVVIGAGTGASLSLAAAATSALATRLRAGMGGALGGLRLAQQAGPAAGPAIGGLAYVAGGLTPAYTVIAGAFLLTAAFALSGKGNSGLVDQSGLDGVRKAG